MGKKKNNKTPYTIKDEVRKLERQKKRLGIINYSLRSLDFEE